MAGKKVTLLRSMALENVKTRPQNTAKLKGFSLIHRLMVAASLLLFDASCSLATMYLQEPFNYPAGILGNNSPWLGSSSLISVTNLALSYPYLMTPSPGTNAVTVNEGSKVVTYCPLTTPATNGCVYFSFLINFPILPGNYYILGLTQSTNASPGGAADDPLDLIDGISGSGYNFGIRSFDSTTSYMTDGSFSLNTNTTYFIVMKYNFTNGGASLYVNPPAGNTEPATPDASSAGTTSVPDLSYVYLRVGSSTAGNYMIGSLRIASTWAEVTTSTNAAAGFSQAAMLSSFLNSLQVETYWIVGTNVNWLTGGSSIYPGPNMTEGNDSHCSAYAAAVADLLGVYILRQPYASDLNLANNQAIWLATNTAGWYPVDTMVDAQHMVNTGALVVASYFNPDNPADSGHIAVLRPSNRTDASVNALGPEECQSGDFNYLDTNAETGFSEHPGSFPSGILYYSHTVSYPVSPANPVFLQSLVSNQIFEATASTIVGRPYQVQWTTNLTAWTPLLNFTNPNDSYSFTTNVLIEDMAASQRFYRLLAK